MKRQILLVAFDVLGRELLVKKSWFLLLAAVLILGSVIFYSKETTVLVSKLTEGVKQKTIVIDSGHGGVDPGKVGVTGVLEKDVNLQIAKKVEAKLKTKGYHVIMTRTEDVGLYSEGDLNKKVADLKKRIEIIHESNPVFAVSIHQNSFPSGSVNGAQVFYYTKSEEGKRIAEIMQESIVEGIGDGNHRKAKANDSYYMLKKTNCPLMIVECGFLSNAEEEHLLSNDEYQEKMAGAIVSGIEKCITQ